jgi:hypothetical protein
MLMTGAWVMISHVMLNRDRVTAGLVTGFLGAFWSYASPPLVGGLSITFLFHRQYKKFAFFILPEVLYVGYYFLVTKIFSISNFRTKDIASAANLAKQFLLQMGSFIDAFFGPSFWLKVYASIASLGWMSIFVATGLAFLASGLRIRQTDSINRVLIWAFVAVAGFGFLIFSITGGYPQMAFNLGNRATYYGSLLLALLIVTVPLPRSVTIGIITIFCFSVVGLSDHWKDWNNKQERVIAAIRSNPQLALFKGDTLLVTGNQYSRLGEMSHIEFLSETYMAGLIFQTALGKPLPYHVRTLNKRFREENGALVDAKYEDDRFSISDGISVYDSERKQIRHVPRSEINHLIASLPSDKRHWIQLIDEGPLRRFALFLMPRLRYMFL